MQNIDYSGYAVKMREILTGWGFSENVIRYIIDFTGLFIVFLVSILVYQLLKFIVNRFLKRLILRSPSKWDDRMYEQKVFSRLALIVPAIIIELFLSTTISDYPKTINFIEIGLELYSAIVLIMVANSFLNAVYHIYGDLEVASSKPIKGYVQIGKIIVFVIGTIIIVSMLIGQSPLNLLAGLGAMSAVLLLIFKDTILGFVAGVQISSNKMLQIGDWMTMPKYNVDGVVIDISLVIVKVRNFDNSVSMIPTYSLITDSFQNWRSMLDAGGRRSKRSVLIDLGSISEVDEILRENLEKYPIPEHIYLSFEGKQSNLGLFRWYMLDFLRKHPDVNQQMTLLVRLLPVTENGLPVEFLLYSLLPDLDSFESFQSGLYEYVLTILPDFGLKVYQRPAAQSPDISK